MTGASLSTAPGAPVLRLVPRPPPRRLLTVRINVLDGRAAYGRSRAFRLAESDIERVIDTAVRLESRA